MYQVKIPDPEFSCIAENLLETWQKANQTFKKIEYTIQVGANHAFDANFNKSTILLNGIQEQEQKIIMMAWLPWLQLKIDGKTYLASSNQKKAAKQVP